MTLDRMIKELRISIKGQQIVEHCLISLIIIISIIDLLLSYYLILFVHIVSVALVIIQFCCQHSLDYYFQHDLLNYYIYLSYLILMCFIEFDGLSKKSLPSHDKDKAAYILSSPDHTYKMHLTIDMLLQHIFKFSSKCYFMILYMIYFLKFHKRKFVGDITLNYKMITIPK